MPATHAPVALIAANRQHPFESALASRDVIGHAKGIIMGRFDVERGARIPTAHVLTQQHSGQHDRPGIAERSGYRYR